MKNLYKLISAGRTPAGIVKHAIYGPGGVEDHRRYFGVWIGMTWPGNENPGYAVMLGEAWFDKGLFASDRGCAVMIWECEYAGLSFSRFIDKVTDAYTSYVCNTIYTDLDQEDHKGAFDDYLDKRNLSGIEILDAPYRDNFYLGLAHIRDMDSAGDLEIERSSKLFEEMRMIQRSDLADNPEVKFPRLNALRYVIGGFVKHPPPAKIKINMPQYGQDEHGWMA